jgi:UDP-N-acetylmuramoylalanine--D-glutamate ligase
MKIAIVGYGLQGQSAYDYWGNDKNDITICDIDPSLKTPPGVKTQLGDDYLQGLSQFDLIVRSPLVHPTDILKANSADILDKITSNTNEFLKVCPTKNVVGITGTKGKGTTTTLIGKMLAAAGLTVHIGGNIGIPPLDLLKNTIEPSDWVVLELANFQLIDLKYSPQVGVCLMVVPEHLNWHTNIEEYIAAKQQLFIHQLPTDIAIYYGHSANSQLVASVSRGNLIPYMEKPGAYVDDNKILIDDILICRTDELKLLGKHNWQNVCAAVTAVWQIKKDAPAIKKVLTNFKGLEHRLELVREFEGVSYYDDSFGTTPETAIVALEAFSQPVIAILGGSDKKSDYTELIQTVVQRKLPAVVSVGETGQVIADSLRACGYTSIFPGGSTMAEIVNIARQHASSGSVVLLSAASASFGLFKDYKDRGDKFKEAVLSLS